MKGKTNATEQWLISITFWFKRYLIVLVFAYAQSFDLFCRKPVKSKHEQYANLSSIRKLHRTSFLGVYHTYKTGPVATESTVQSQSTSYPFIILLLMQVQAQCCAKVMETKFTDLRQLFAWNFIELGRFSLAPRVISPKQRAIFLRIFISERKFAMKSLGKTKQFSARHARSSCHVMNTKQDIKISPHRRFQTVVWTVLIVFWLYLRCV